jgi:hypothetical protein
MRKGKTLRQNPVKRTTEDRDTFGEKSAPSDIGHTHGGHDRQEDLKQDDSERAAQPIEDGVYTVVPNIPLLDKERAERRNVPNRIHEPFYGMNSLRGPVGSKKPITSSDIKSEKRSMKCRYYAANEKILQGAN